LKGCREKDLKAQKLFTGFVIFSETRIIN